MKQIDHELADLLTLKIPEGKPLNIGFLEIIGFSHYETINSKIYAYFLSHENKVISNLFLDTLLELIKEKSGFIADVADLVVTTEEVTKKGRIDIVLRDPNSNYTILIENKIYHYLNNDLQDYWDHVESPDDKKIGLVLSLKKEIIPIEVSSKFYSITHHEWASKIFPKLNEIDIPNNEHVYISDFCKTLFNLTYISTMNEKTQFFFEHAPQVLKAIETRNDALRFVIEQIEIVAEHLELETYGKNGAYRNLWNPEKTRHTFYTMSFDNLLNGSNKLYIMIEMDHVDLPRISELDVLLKDDKTFDRLKKDGTSTDTWRHYAYQEYVLDIEQIRNLADTIEFHIKNDFESVMEKIHMHIYNTH